MKPLVALAVLVALAGCAAQPTHTAASSAPLSTAPQFFSATGSAQKTLTVPAGANSADVTITCGSDDGGIITIAIGAQDQPRGGSCPSSTRFRTAAHGTLDLAVGFAGGSGRFVAQVRFSADPFAPDPRATSQCTALGSAFSDVTSAQNGYPRGPLDLAGWQKLMSSAGTKLSSIDGTGAIGTQVPTLTDWYGGSDPTPAAPSSAAATQAFEIVTSLCLDNGTPLVIVSQYGG